MADDQKPREPATARISGDCPSEKSALRHIVELDQVFSRQIYDTFQPLIPRRILKTLEISGDGRIWIPIPIAILLAARSPTIHRVAVGLLAGFLIDLLFVGLIKHLVRRSRPLYNKDMFLTFAVDHWSFPSGHSSRVFFISTFLYFVRRSPGEGFNSGKNGETYLWFVFLWSGVTSISRVLLGRHFILDVLVGGCLGVINGLLIILLFYWVDSHL